MVPRLAESAAVALLVVAAALLANPLYITPPADGGDVLVSADRTSAAAGAADLSSEIERVDDLPPVAAYAARRALENGSHAVASDGPPLALQLLGDEWRYLGSAGEVAFFRPTVTVGDETTTLELERRSVESVESDLGITPPDSLTDRNHAKEVLWVAHQSDEVVVAGEFTGEWESRLRRAVANGSVTVPNGNDASVYAPLGGEVRFLVRDDQFYRVAVGGDSRTTVLRLAPERDAAVLDATNVSVVETSDLSPATRRVITEAIATDGTTQVRRDEVNASRLDAIEGRLVRHEDAYYVVRRGHADDFSLVPLVRTILTAVGLVFAVAGLALGAWARRRDR
ncbi:MAG: hypothetical protein ABEJ78_02010 [Haloferacaceae archaeon]